MLALQRIFDIFSAFLLCLIQPSPSICWSQRLNTAKLIKTGTFGGTFLNRTAN